MKPLTSSQLDIYFDQLRLPHLPMYNIGARIEIKGKLDVEQMNRAYQAMITQHDVLCRTLVREGNEIGFRALETKAHPLIFQDVSTASEASKTADEFILNHFKQVYSFEKDQRLYDTFLIKITQEEYILYAKYHHLLTDGWGTSLLFQQIVNNYNDLLNTGLVTNAKPFLYTDFIANDQQYINSDKYTIDKAYWKHKFEVLPERAFSKKSNYTSISARKSLIVERTIYNQINTFAKTHRVSTFHIIIAALLSYLNRFYDQQDWVLGLPVLNRSSAKFKKTVGLFMGVSPLRVKIEEEASLLFLIQDIKQKLREDYRHQRFPFGHLIKELGLYEEDTTLFDISLSYEKHDYSDAFKGTETRVYPLTNHAEQHAIAIHIREFDKKESVRIDFDYSKGYFDDQEMAYLISAFEKITKLIIKAPETPIGSLSIVDQKEAHTLLNIFNHTKQAYDEKASIGLLIDQQAERFPDKIALRDQQRNYTYREFKNRSHQIAVHLQKKYGTKHPIAVLMNRSADLLLLLTGILKSGNSYIPLDPKFPKTRLKHILKASAAQLLITDQRVEGDGLQTSENTVIQAEQLINLELSDKSSLLTTVRWDATAYIIYTSGSTGIPKGVEIQHRSVVNFLQSMQKTPGIKNEDLLLSVTTPSFDISVLEFFLPLVSGATCYIADSETLSDPIKIIALLEQINPSIIQATPSFYQLLFNAGWNGSKLLTVLCGGDILNDVLAAKIINSCRALWNMYGPTETTIWSSVKRIVVPEQASIIGRPIDNTDFYLLDKKMKLKPIGALGHIFIGGAGLAKGYYNDEALSKERFVINPLNGTLVYNTGDLGIWNKDGEIIFMGRSDHQVKVRGYRIELGEIEKQLLAIQGIQEAVVLAKKDQNAGAFLVAFIKQRHALLPEELIAFLSKILPDYMIPRVFIPIEVFPLTPNKKIDRRALLAKNISYAEELCLPNTALEKQLKPIWETVLEIEIPSINNNFFALGGHSLKAMQLIRAITDATAIQVPLQAIFKYPTIKSLAQYMLGLNKTKVFQLPKVKPGNYFNLTPNQLNIWYANQKEEANIAYNMYAVFSINGYLDPLVLVKAVNLLIEKHEILRTRIVQFDGAPRQCISDQNRFSLDEISLLENQTENLQLQKFIAKPFDLAKDLLLRLGILNNQVLVFVTHHIILDGASIRLLTNELALTYNTLLKDAGPQTALKKRDFQYKDYSEWYNSRLAGDWGNHCENYWTNRLQGLQETETFIKGGLTQTFKGKKITIIIEKSEIEKIAQSFNVSLFSMLLSSIGILIFRMTGKKDFCIGVPTLGRSLNSLQSMIGMFVNTLAFRMSIPESEPLRILAKNTNENLQNDLVYEDYTIENSPLKSKYRNGFFDIMVVSQNPDFSINEIPDFEGVNLTLKSMEHFSSRLPITFNFITENENDLKCEIEYDEGLFDEATIAIIIKKYQKLIQQIVTKKDVVIKDYNLQLDIENTIIDNQIDITFNF